MKFSVRMTAPKIKGIDLLDMSAQGDDYLHAASADIDHDIACSFHVKVVQGAQSGQFRFFLTADDRDLQADGVCNRLDKGITIRSLPDGACGDRLDTHHSVAVDNLLHPDKGFHGPLPGRPGYGAILDDPFPQAHSRLLVIQHPELPSLSTSTTMQRMELVPISRAASRPCFIVRSLPFPLLFERRDFSIAGKLRNSFARFAAMVSRTSSFGSLGRKAFFPDNPGEYIEIVHLSQAPPGTSSPSHGAPRSPRRSGRRGFPSGSGNV